MTFVTLRSEIAVMRIVVAMTAITQHRQLDFVLHLVFMARMTVYAVVFAIQRKIGLRIMIELPREPIVRTVTQFAFRTQPFLVDIVLDVARRTLDLRILVRVRGMALLACYKHMGAM